MAYGITHYAIKWDDGDLRRLVTGSYDSILSAPREQGPFPTVFNFEKQAWEGALFWTARSLTP